MKRPVKRAAVIHDLCGVGKAALTNILPVLSVLEIEACPIPTMILSSHTGGLGIPVVMKMDNYIERAVAHYSNLNINFEGIFIGYLGSIKNIEESISCLKSSDREHSIIIVDPIFGDHGKYYSNFDESYSNKLRELIEFADIITPNYTEACLICDKKISEYVEKDDIHKICIRLCEFGCRNVVITSVPLKNEEFIGTAVYMKENDQLYIIESMKQQKSYPGTGDIFTSVLLGSLLNGVDLIKACECSCLFVEKCMKVSSEYDYPSKEGVLLEKCLKYLYGSGIIND